MIRASRRGGFDWILFGAVAALLLISTLEVWSVTHRVRGDSYLIKQVINIAIGGGLMVAAARTDYRMIRLFTPIIYVASLVGLLLVPVIGREVNGNLGWIFIGPFSIQPAEFAKVAVVVAMAMIIAERTERRGRTAAVVTARDVIAMLLPVIPPAILIILEPDLGTLIVLGVTVFGVLAIAGTPGKWLGLMAGGAVVGSVVVAVAGLLKQYQVDRFLAFMHPDRPVAPGGPDPAFNVRQSITAIGNGGWFGRGPLHGDLTRGSAVPEQQTDFLFSAVGEELGLIGAVLVVILLGIVLWRTLLIARNAPDLFSRVCAAGFATWFGFQAFENAGMCLGIMPVTGVPLPFMSYGGSAMFSLLAAVGLLQNFHRRSVS
jgi:rod shape determining protein RodA